MTTLLTRMSPRRTPEAMPVSSWNFEPVVIPTTTRRSRWRAVGWTLAGAMAIVAGVLALGTYLDREQSTPADIQAAYQAGMQEGVLQAAIGEQGAREAAYRAGYYAAMNRCVRSPL